MGDHTWLIYKNAEHAFCRDEYSGQKCAAHKGCKPSGTGFFSPLMLTNIILNITKQHIMQNILISDVFLKVFITQRKHHWSNWVPPRLPCQCTLWQVILIFFYVSLLQQMT